MDSRELRVCPDISDNDLLLKFEQFVTSEVNVIRRDSQAAWAVAPNDPTISVIMDLAEQHGVIVRLLTPWSISTRDKRFDRISVYINPSYYSTTGYHISAISIG